MTKVAFATPTRLPQVGPSVPSEGSAGHGNGMFKQAPSQQSYGDAGTKVPQLAGVLGVAAAFAGKRRVGRRHPRSRQAARSVCRARGGEEHMSDIAMWTGLTPGKEYRLQTKTCSVAPETRTIRSLDWDRDRFDI
eukprot:6019624-Amphidinium_carterae.1